MFFPFLRTRPDGEAAEAPSSEPELVVQMADENKPSNGDDDNDDGAAALRREGEEPSEEEDADVAALNVGVFIEAMSKCVAFYHQTNKLEFYAMVAEEFSALIGNSDEVPVQAMEKMELSLQRIASDLLSSAEDSTDVDLPRDVEPHVGSLLAFYKALGSTNASGNEEEATYNNDGVKEEVGDGAPHEAVRSPAGQTDGSASNPATPVEDRTEEPPASLENAPTDRTGQPPAPLSTEITAATTTVTTQTATSPPSSQATYGHAKATLFELTRAHAESKERLSEQEELLKSEKLRTKQKKREYKELKALVKQYRQRDQERRAVQRLLADDEGGDSDSESERLSNEELRKLHRKEIKRLRRLQDTLSLKFQLLQSEDKRHRMEIEQQMAQLRNEYTDSYVFGQ